MRFTRQTTTRATTRHPRAGAGRLARLLTASAAALSAVMAPLAAAPPGVPAAVPSGAVYVATNGFGGNEIQTFVRFGDGSLQPGPTVATGGTGTGPHPYPLLAGDPLGSQDSLIVDEARQLLFVANTGSNDVSAFRVSPSGLTRTDVHTSNGAYPIGLAFRNQTLYVLNAASNSLAGFTVDGAGRLSDLGTCQLPDLPAPLEYYGGLPMITESAGQVGFSPDGTRLVVVSKEGPMLDGFPFGATSGSGRLHVYDVDAQGRLSNCGAPRTTSLPHYAEEKNRYPFSFTWGVGGELLVTEVFGASTGFGGSAVSSWAFDGSGTLVPTSGPIANGQTATCWIVRSGDFIYAANYLSDSISSYRQTAGGGLSLVDPRAASYGTGFPTPSHLNANITITSDGRYIYQLAPSTDPANPNRPTAASILPFAVNAKTGKLTPHGASWAGAGALWVGRMGLANITFR